MTTTLPKDGTIVQKPTDGQAQDIFYALDAQLNSMMVGALTHGIYTGLIVFTFSTAAYNNPLPPRVYLAVGIAAGVSTILTDATLIWRCWIVWGRSSGAILVPVISTTLAVVSKGIVLYHNYADGHPENTVLYAPNSSRWAVIYSSAILGTLLWCTVLIVYRILSVVIDPRCNCNERNCTHNASRPRPMWMRTSRSLLEREFSIRISSVQDFECERTKSGWDEFRRDGFGSFKI
ncbi:hypothetical protein F5146DRAFT_997695 [Armillaria mellea]|nr:hypothetical protein F5146DRAFT_997695 [Armillaria mellea]